MVYLCFKMLAQEPPHKHPTLSLLGISPSIYATPIRLFSRDYFQQDNREAHLIGSQGVNISQFITYDGPIEIQQSIERIIISSRD